MMYLSTNCERAFAETKHFKKEFISPFLKVKYVEVEAVTIL